MPTRKREAFSLVEILVAVGLMSFIILGLLAMFLQTQRAFRASITQVDVLESGRAVTEMLGRELEQMSPSQVPGCINFFMDIPKLGSPPYAQVSSTTTEPLYQALPGSAQRRTNTIDRFFFLTRQNRDWIGTGYQVIADTANAGVGTLYRFSQTIPGNFRYPTPYPPLPTPAPLCTNFVTAPLTNLSRIADGVIHLRVRAFDTKGNLITPAQPGLPAQPAGLKNTTWLWDPYVPDEIACTFFDSALPAYLELEIGFLEPRTLERCKALGNVAAQRAYLSNRCAQVHLFRQRIPIRNVDFSAYQ
jgi:type II secretory pathway pseudopilin PulG